VIAAQQQLADVLVGGQERTWCSVGHNRQQSCVVENRA